MASLYVPRISETVGADERDAAIIEQIMRVDSPTLDWLSPNDFDNLAWAAKDALAWDRANDPETASFYARQAGVPA